MWFYVDNGTRRGPHSLEQLAAALVAAPDPQHVLVWRDGLTGWQPAATVPELAGALPRPVARPAPEPPRVISAIERAPMFGAASVPELAPDAAEEAVAVATHYRRLVLLVGAQILVAIALEVLGGGASAVGALIGLSLLAAGFGLSVVMAVTVYRLMGVLGGVPALWALGTFIPLLNIVLLLVISAKAQAWCRRRGIEVGFLGPTPASIERLRHGG